MFGFFPPNSNVTGHNLGAALIAIIFPTEKEPVKVTFLTYSSSIIGSRHSSR
jgi:hypothetical protein